VGRTTIPELDQPLMVVVVLVEIARIAKPTAAAEDMFRVNGQAYNI
jgi:hypothetical protein